MGADSRYSVTVSSVIERDGEQEKMSSRSTGSYEYTPGRAVIKYYERSQEEDILCEVIAEGEKVIIKRGTIMTLRLERDVARMGEYRLPFGSLELTYRARSIDNALREDGGTLTLVYDMNIGGSDSLTRVEIAVTSSEKQA